MTDEDALITVHEFANRFRVDVSVVRSWVKRGHIPYVLVGPRKMIRVPDLVRPIGGVWFDRFDSYPLSDDYMLMAPAQVPVEVPNGPVAPVPDRRKDKRHGRH